MGPGPLVQMDYAAWVGGVQSEYLIVDFLIMILSPLEEDRSTAQILCYKCLKLCNNGNVPADRVVVKGVVHYWGADFVDSKKRVSVFLVTFRV